MRSDRPIEEQVVRVETAAQTDAAGRLGLEAEDLEARDRCGLAKWAAAAGVRQLATAAAPRGSLRDWLDGSPPALTAAGIDLREGRRDRDEAIWPHARAGVFKVEKIVPRLVPKLELAS